MENRKDLAGSGKNNVELNSKQSNSNMVKWILGAGIVLVTGLAIFLGVNGNFFKGETERLTSELSDLNVEKEQLQGEIVDLEGNYETQITENQELTVKIEERVQEVEQLKGKLSKVRSQLVSSKKNTEEIRNRLAQIEALKAALEEDIVNLKDENAELLATTDELSTKLMEKEVEVAQLNFQVATLTEANTSMNDRLYRLAPAGYRADNFAIKLEKKNSKMTNKAKQVDKIKVSFDLDHVPTDRQGNGELYIAVTNALGQTIKEIPTSEVLVKTRAEDLKIQVADIQEVDLKLSQSVDMSFNPGKDLQKGEYNLLVYSKAGYLGSTGFSLR